MGNLNTLACAAAGAIILASATARVDAAEPGAIYQRNCAACHGEKGDGNSRAQATLSKKPRDFTAQESRSRLTREYMIAIVRDGRPHTPMIARGSRLSQEEIEAVVDFIRGNFMSTVRQAPPAKAD